MVKVITYGTYDLLHYGHIRLLERAKALGDYLIVGVTADDFDKTRGKINVQQTLMERVEAIKATGIADEIIIEEYEGQKIDDIKRYGIDIFTVGSDWVGTFDYLNEYCKVVYLDRTQGVSSSELRSEKRSIKLGIVGEGLLVLKHINESSFVNGLEVATVCTLDDEIGAATKNQGIATTKDYDELLNACDAVYVFSHPEKHYEHIKKALENGKHVLCESPIALEKTQCTELFALAREKGLVLMETVKTAFSTAYNRLMLLVKSGKIGEVTSIDATCTSMRDLNEASNPDYSKIWNSICAWGPTALLPVFQILGTEYCDKKTVTRVIDEKYRFDAFTKIDFIYDGAVASVKVGKGVKSEGSLVISGTKGYVYVPAPWWKTDYFEIRYENPADNRRYFYQLDGEGIRYELVNFCKAIQTGNTDNYIGEKVSEAITTVIEDYYSGKDTIMIK
ncbi:MAG: glycerol-3-phosphate cytidylyltransferase [Ruminococcaceae bacterium]|nr:glycerol-3-phosphate cytidylyltransferase [Oscillospiraceae bacterium]